MEIIFYYNDGRAYKKELQNFKDKEAVEIGVLRALYSIALESPENFKEHYVVAYEIKDGEKIIDSHIYTKVERVKKNETV